MQLVSMCPDGNRSGRALVTPDDPNGQRKFDAGVEKANNGISNLLATKDVCDPVDVYCRNDKGEVKLLARESSILGSLFAKLRNAVMGGETPYVGNETNQAGMPVETEPQGVIIPKEIY